LKTRRRQHIGYVALLIRDYDEAKDYYIKTLGFDLVEDTRLADGKRWVLVAPPGSSETRLLLAKASSPEQVAQIGRQSLFVSSYR
jgi:catechol 2,3-dioxygenase-like lactoylglutathione lyase family enzyme